MMRSTLEVKMKKCETIFCKLCSSIIIDGHFKLIDDLIRKVLDVLLSELNVEENHEHVICNACNEKLLVAFNFKATCMDTEDSIYPYVDSENGIPVDLKEIYLKLRGKEHLSSVVEDERICRLCMQFITTGFTNLGEIEMEFIHKYIPEVNFNCTVDPVICSLCLDSLNTHSSFLKNCLELDKKVKNIADNCAMKGPFSIKNESIKIKTEEYDENCLDVQEKIKNIDENCITKGPFCIISEKIEIKTEEHDVYEDTSLQDVELADVKILSNDSPNLSGSTQTKSLNEYKCDICNHKTKRKGNLIDHQLIHKDFSEVPIYKCDACDYRTKLKGKLTRHQLKHKNFSEVPVFKCDTCGYVTKFKDHLMRHLLKHKDFSEVPVYKCYKCDFGTKLKYTLMQHQLTHKDFPEVLTYKCDICDYKSKYKGCFKRHQLKHKDFSEVQVYKCDLCDFKTKIKGNLTRHHVKHKDFPEVPIHKCNACDFVTKFKNTLTRHELTHKDFSEVQVYMCDQCDYKSKRKGSLVAHQHRRHKNLSKMSVYK